MAILPKIEEHEASLEVQEIYKKVKARYGGFLPDIYKACLLYTSDAADE